MHTLSRHSFHVFQFETWIKSVEINNITIYYLFSELCMCDQSAFSHSWHMFSVPTSRTLHEVTYYCYHALHFSVYWSLNTFYILTYIHFVQYEWEKKEGITEYLTMQHKSVVMKLKLIKVIYIWYVYFSCNCVLVWNNMCAFMWFLVVLRDMYLCRCGSSGVWDGNGMFLKNLVRQFMNI